jgi:anthranilate phosphoribosyltransferase
MLWWPNILEKLARREDLTLQEACEAGRRIFTYLKERRPETPLVLACYFAGLSVKGATTDELVGMAQAMEETRGFTFDFKVPKPIVTGGGTGGDTLKTINVTTPAILIAASAGAVAVKSAARAFSGKTGSADLAVCLGINIGAPPETVKQCVENLGIAVWASSGIYPWMEPLLSLRGKSYAPLLFPMMESLRLVVATALNPFSVRRQVRGTALPRTELIATVLGKVGFERALVPLGYGPHEGIRIDEFSNIGRTVVSELKENGEVETYDVYPEDFGIRRGTPEEIQAAETHEENARRVLGVITGRDRGSRRDLILANAAAVLYLADMAEDLRDGYELASQAVDEGLALRKLEQLVEASGGQPARLRALLSSF